MESNVAPVNRNWTDNQAVLGQCTPMNPPSLGTLKLVAGNGTSVGTVMTLVCPVRHRPISGGLISCLQERNSTPHWNGGTPECKSLSFEEGFRLAMLLSIVSTAIILLMSIIFITSCLLKRVKKEEMKEVERERRRETDRLWHQLNAEEQRESFYNHNGRNNNNSNSISRQEQHPGCHWKNHPDPIISDHLQPTMEQISPTCPVYDQVH